MKFTFVAYCSNDICAQKSVIKGKA